MSLNPNSYLQLRSIVSYNSADRTTDRRTTILWLSIADHSTWDTPQLAQYLRSAQVWSEYTSGKINDIQTTTHWNVIGRSVIAPPSVLFSHPWSLMRFTSRKEMFGANYQIITPIFQFLKLPNSGCILMFAATVHSQRRPLPNDTNGFAVPWLPGLT